MADPKQPRHYDEVFKRQIVQSCESGKPSREIRAECDIARSTLQRWIQGIRNSGSIRAADNRTPEPNEPVEPGRRDRQLEMEVDVFRTSGAGIRPKAGVIRANAARYRRDAGCRVFPAPPVTG